jgi:hypothetical protein
MRRALQLVLLLLLTIPGLTLAQTSTVTATVTDSDSQTWNNGIYSVQLVSSTTGASIPAGQAFRSDTGATITNTFSGTLSGTGTLSLSLTSVSYITPSAVTWKFQVCPAVSTPICGTVSIPINSSQSVSTQLNSVILAPRISGGQGAYAYADVEVAATRNSTYYNTTSSTCRYYGSSWGVCGSGGAGAVSSVFGRTGAVAAASGDYTAAQVGALPIPIVPNSGMIVAGDSRCATNSPPNNWSVVVQSLSQFSGKISEYVNTCVSGRTIEQMAAAYFTEVQPYKPATTGVTPTYLFVYVGTNDLGDGNETPATAYTALAAYWAQAQSDGFTVVAMTEPMRGTTLGGAFTQNNIEQFNDLIRTAPAGDYTVLLDMSLALPDPYNQNFFLSDYIHPNLPQGNLVEAEYINFVFGGPKPGLIEEQFDGRRSGLATYTCDITGFGLTAYAGEYNTACGTMAGQNVTSGTYNTALGAYGLNGLTTGTENTAAGSQAAWQATSSNYLTALGANSLYSEVSGSGSTAVGFYSLYADTIGGNTALGYQSLSQDSTGTYNVAAGYNAAHGVTTANDVSAFGYAALQTDATGADDTAFGMEALLNTTAVDNTAIGSQALLSDSGGSSNTASGYKAAGQTTTGAGNVAVGATALYGNTTGANNVALGENAGRYQSNGSTALIPNNSVFLGEGTEGQTNSDTNEIVIGYSTTGNGANTTTIGNGSVTDTYLEGIIHATSLVNGMTATTQTTGDTSTDVATDAFVLANVNSGAVSSFNTRTGAVVPAPGDYTAAQVTNAAATNTANTFTAAQVAPAFKPQTLSSGPQSNLFDDFYSVSTVSAFAIGSPTTDSCNLAIAGDVNHPGVFAAISGTAGSGTGVSCVYGASNNAPLLSINTSLGWTWESDVNVVVLPGTTAATYQATMTHLTSASPSVTGLGFEMSSGNGVANDWYCMASSNLTDSTVAPTANTYTRLTMVNDGTYIHWYVNGTQVCGTGLSILSGNVPSTAQVVGDWTSASGSASSVSMLVDYLAFQRAVSR